MEKDYYKTLEVNQTANEQEIKKAYRQLVLKLHPDRNEGNSTMASKFREVQEAYEILSHPARRSAYNQRRWYHNNHRNRDQQPAMTPYALLHRSQALNSYLASLRINDINRVALFKYIIYLLSDTHIKILESADDKAANEFIIKEIIKASEHLSYKNVSKIYCILLRLAGSEPRLRRLPEGFLKNKRHVNNRERYLPLAVLIISLLLCLLIYFASNLHS
jgi:molecular chaperone DnaJ